jgi:hypothetical protein
MRLDQSHCRCQLVDCGLVGMISLFCFIFYGAQTFVSCTLFFSILHVSTEQIQYDHQYITQLEKEQTYMNVVYKQILADAN